MKNQESRTLYTVTCPCGGWSTALDARSFGRPQVCRKCGTQFTVAWRKDPVTLRNAPVTVSLARKRAPTPLRLSCTCGYKKAATPAEAARHNRCPGCGKVMIVEKPPAAKSRDSNRIIKLSSTPQTLPPMPILPVPSKETPETRLRRMNPQTPTPTFDKPGLICECGRGIEVLKALEGGGEYTCPACGRSVRMEKFRGSQSKHTVIRPIFGPKTPPPVAPPAQPAPAPETEAVFSEIPDERTDAPPADAASSSGSYQELFCPCGEALMIGMEDAGKNVQCPTCLTLISVEVLRDSRTGGQALRVRAIGKIDQDTWSLNDFQ
ncbi:MAG TPA: hypothetical protein VKW04_22665 [Planctomycetota bacterium]|nr:hypothetical protein [Planctomycetota bacterium]